MSIVHKDLIADYPDKTYQQMAKEQQIQKQMDKLAAIEKAMEAMKVGHGGSQVGTAARQLTLKENLIERLEQTERQLERLKQAKEELDGLAVREGDAAFHPVHGNVIVRRLFMGDATSTIAVRKEDDGKIMAEVVGMNSQVCVVASELVLVTDATRVLYGKKA